jgi:DNA polymerase III subunit alpha
VGFYLSGHPLDDYAGPLKRKDVLTLAEVTRRAERGPSSAHRRVRLLAAGAQVGARQPLRLRAAVRPDRALRGDGLLRRAGGRARASGAGQQRRPEVEATMEADTLKLLARGAQPVDAVVADAGAAGLKVRIAESDAVGDLAEVLGRHRGEPAPKKARGPLYCCVPDPATGGEIEVEIGGDLPLTPRLRGELRVLPGVLEVEEV